MKIALIVSTEWDSYYASSPYYYLRDMHNEMIDVFSVNLASANAVSELKAQLGDGYGCVICCEGSIIHFLNQHVPCGVIVDDLHRYSHHAYDTYDNRLRADFVLSTYALTVAKGDFPLSVSTSDRRRFVYFPHYTVDRPVQTRHSSRSVLCIPGTTSLPAYPLRTKLIEAFSDLDPLLKTRAIRGDFIDLLGNYRVGITDDVRFGYCVAKYFEIPMAGALLVAPEPHSSLEKWLLGFDADNSCLLPRSRMYDIAYIRRTVMHLFDDLHATEARAIRGQVLVRSRHTVQARARYLCLIASLLQKGSIYQSDQFECFLAAAQCPEERPTSVNAVLSNGDSAALGGSMRCMLYAAGVVDIQEILSKLPHSVQEVHIIAASLQECYKLQALLLQHVRLRSISFELSDRTAFERNRGRFDLTIEVGSLLQECTPWLKNFVYDAPFRSQAEIVLEWWRNLYVSVLSRQFQGLSMVVDEAFDWDYGGIEFWLGNDQSDMRRLRIERILHPDPYAGFIRPDWLDKDVALKDVTSKMYSASASAEETEHWIAFFRINGYFRLDREDNIVITDAVDVCSLVMRLLEVLRAFVDVCDRS